MNVHDNRFDWDDLAFLNPAQAALLDGVTVEQGDVLLNITGASVARCCSVPPAALPARVNQHVAIIRADRAKAVPKFIEYTLTSPNGKARLLAIAQGGATREALTKGGLERFEIPVPSVAVQQKIAAILSAYDDLIENNSRRIKLLDEMAQRIYHEWFVDFRYPGHEDTPRVDSELGPIPKGWAVSTIGKVSHRVVDGDWIETKDQGGKGYRLLQVSNVGLGSFRETGKYRYISEDTFTRLRCTEITLGSILVSRMPDPIGRAWYVDHLDEPAITAVDVAIVEPDPAAIDPRYCAFYLNSPRNLQHAAQRASGTTRLRITRRDLETFPIPVPPADVRATFGAFLEDSGRLRLALTRATRDLTATRDLLLPRLIGGEIDVEGLDIAIPDMAA
jgi:type I restriction enzyme S subunit